MVVIRCTGRASTKSLVYGERERERLSRIVCLSNVRVSVSLQKPDSCLHWEQSGNKVVLSTYFAPRCT